ncbi:uncharacterized protein LOC34620278 [Cyclospora cayetanensis]|uniref:Uncharacterized protein LOC34620278 n=1 Tax=Cyclospora cayetanensis TaxID=88456 RepID=A0A6P6RVM5_9EIME|nr:uncharacterized protein LOC34620278 [Cyclospora cayetanensis]
MDAHPGKGKAVCAARAYDQLPLKTEEMTVTKMAPARLSVVAFSQKGNKDVVAIANQSQENGKSNNHNVVRLLEAERVQMHQSQELLVGQHTKIDDSLQLILDEITSLKAQAAEENDLNALMVQFIVMAIRILMEASFNQEKVGDLLPVLEAELERLQLPARHPRLLACFNRLREACGKAPVTQCDLASMAVVISAASSDEVLPSKSVSSGTAGIAASAAAGEIVQEQSLSESRRGGSGWSNRAVPFATQTTLIDEPDDYRKSSLTASEQFPVVAVRHLNRGASSAHTRLPKSSASAEFSSRRESVFTPGERRRTATAFGDGDLPLFQQFAVAAAAPAPDELSGLGKPMDTAILSQTTKLPFGEGTLEGSDSDLQEPRLSKNLGGSVNSSDIGSINVSSSIFRHGDIPLEWNNKRPSRTHSEMDTEVPNSAPEMRDSFITAKALSSGTLESFDGLLHHATTILSMTPSELRAALLRSATGAKSDGALKQSGQHHCTRDGVEPASRMDSEGPPAPMPSLTTSVSLDHLQILKDAMVAVAKAAAKELGEAEIHLKDEPAGVSLDTAILKQSVGGAEQEQLNSSVGATKSRVSVGVEASVQKESPQISATQTCTTRKTLLPDCAIKNDASVDPAKSSALGSPFAGCIAPPSTPDALAYPRSDYPYYPMPPQNTTLHAQGPYLPANQLAWQQFFNRAAASERQVQERSYLGSHAVAHGQRNSQIGEPFAAYQVPAGYPILGATFQSDSTTGSGLMYVANARCEQARVPEAQGLLDTAYGPSAVPTSSYRIACQTAPISGKEHGSIVGQPRLFVAHTHAWQAKPRGVPPHSTAGVAQQNFETPRIEGWACCHRMTRGGKHSIRKASNH